jgi:alkaline phosphatase D
MNNHRRHFLKVAGTVLLTAAAPFSARILAGKPASVFFREGVASGDPDTDSIILWTRAEPATGDNARLLLQVSEREDFAQVVLEASLTARAAQDFTVRARVQGLKPGHIYFYRFNAVDGGQSRVGRSMTAPAAEDARPVHLAFASCQNYEQGFYGAWERMLEDDRQKPADEQIQFVLHLGDFVYERYRHRPAEGQTFVRRLPPFPDGARGDGKEWAHSLADYRHLYQTHLRDPLLQDARARWPFICTWDDHEFSNDSFGHFSTYDGIIKAEASRQRDAHQAWFEYIPAQVEQTPEQLRIYRRLRWGQMVDLLITDLRSYRTGPALPPGISDELGLPMDPVQLVAICDGGRAYNHGEPPEFLPFGDGTLPNTARNREPGTMLGAEQKSWFKQAMQESTAPWKVWGNSLPILPLRLDLSSIPLAGMHDGILSEDAWAGFPTEYAELMNFVDNQGVTGLVSLSGDHHMHGAATLVVDPDAEIPKAVAADFNVTGISSSNHFINVLHRAGQDESDFRQLVAEDVDGEISETWNMTLHYGVLASMAFSRTGWSGLSAWLGPNGSNPGLAYVDSNSNGYGLAQFSADSCEVQLVTVSDATRPPADGGKEVARIAAFSLPLWTRDQEPTLVGPDFTGVAPFPYGE